MNDFRNADAIPFFSIKYPCNIAPIHKEIVPLRMNIKRQ